MKKANEQRDRIRLTSLAHSSMLEHGLVPDFPKEVLAELAKIKEPETFSENEGLVDMRSELWCSLDNDDSRDLDQLATAEALGDGRVKLLIAIADVDAFVKKDSALDQHAQQNTTSVYTAPVVF